MEKIKRIVVDDIEVCLKKSGDSFRIVHPIKKDLDAPLSLKNINWKNLIAGGSWKNLGMVAMIITVILGVLNEYSTNIRVLQEAAKLCPTIILP